MKGKVLKIVVLILLAVFVVNFTVSIVKTLSSTVNIVANYQLTEDSKREILTSSIRGIIGRIASIAVFLFLFLKIIFSDIQAIARIKYSSEQIDEYISILKSRRQAKKKARDEKRRKKLQEKLNKYEES